jgi:hypothetical protein
MNYSGMYRLLSGIGGIAIICGCTFFTMVGQTYSCDAGKRPLYFFADSSLSVLLPEGFGNRLYGQLRQPLEEIGYCLYALTPAVLRDTTVQDELVMCFTLPLTITTKKVTRQVEPDSGYPADSTVSVTVPDTSAQMVVSLLPVATLRSGRLQSRGTSPLLSVNYTTDELSTFESVIIRKAIENLRDQYICHLRIESNPEGVAISSRRGLEGITPLEWIIPVGRIIVTGEIEGYEPIRRAIDLKKPGNHTYMIDMSKRRFYHSRFFVPTLVLGASSAVCFVMERYYYNRYHQLDRDDRGKSPDPFERNFTIAKNFERAAAGTLGLAGISLVCSFIF